MKLSTTVYYHRHYRPTKYCQKVRYDIQSETYDVEIATPTSEDCKLVFVAKDYKNKINVYAYRNHLYRNILHPTRFANAEHLQINPMKPYAEYKDRPFCEGKSVLISDKTKESYQKAIEPLKNYDDYIFFNGEFLEKTSEPLYNYCTFGLGHNHGGTGFFISWEYNENLGAECYFSATEKKEAIAAAVNVAKRRGDTESVYSIENTDCDIWVADPKFVNRNPAKDHVSGTRLSAVEEAIECGDNVVDSALLSLAALMK